MTEGQWSRTILLVDVARFTIDNKEFVVEEVRLLNAEGWPYLQCSGWELEQLQALAGRMELRKVKHGSVVMKQGDQAAAMFFIKCGRVRVLRCIKSGQIARLLSLDPLLSARYPSTALHEL